MTWPFWHWDGNQVQYMYVRTCEDIKVSKFWLSFKAFLSPAAYVALGLIPFEFACRHAVDSVFIQIFPKANQERFATYRTAGEGFLIYAVSLGISLAVPGQSGKIIAVTGILLTIKML